MVDQPYWDLAVNWSAGAPTAPDTNVQLGQADTVLRSGSFQAARIEGIGRLDMSGGRLQLHGDGSTLKNLDLSGGQLSGPGSLTIGQLNWTGGDITGSPGGAGAAPRITLTGGANITGGTTRVMAAGGALTFRGYSFWISNDFHLFSPLRIEKGATFVDQAYDRTHELRLHADAEFAGLYRKQTGNTRVLLGRDASFRNSGAMVAESGYLEFRGGRSWENSGQLAVGSAGWVSLFDSSETRWSNSGHIRVERELTARVSRHGMTSSGSWLITRGGSARFTADRMAPEIVFEQGIQNDGGLVLSGDPQAAPSREPLARYRMEGAGLTGSGSVWVERAHLDLGDEYVNQGRFAINSAEVQVGRYRQDRAGASTQVGWLLTANEVLILEGQLNTGGHLNGRIDGHLTLGGDATFEARSGEYGTTLLDITGSATLDGTLLLRTFAPLRLGSHRLLQAAGGVTGSFDEFVSDVDPKRYLLTLSYGSDWVALNVAAVPEPETYALVMVGLAALVVRVRQRSTLARASSPQGGDPCGS
ncbi:PEP-CTERM sorting domain-containing protein [Eleftheria terrae]|uniref:PEP-CTERM sorting domain-containing protein n=1 Tax=Eleftheria terrae TaxID=1597781 RepID=UPI00263B97FC|nr:PEP-CTERM sorting domain-containing protein [Eleftheria terrae]WKB55407.1 PEP-CTERM sorting domain-containing protein [Eleftheria terrae]